MPKPPQDIYARHLLSPRGYPLWTPEPSNELLIYRPDGLRIGDVGVVIPEDGCFDVFFNVCLPADHTFHRATGVPHNFKHIALDDMDIRTIVNAENPGRILANSSVKSVSTAEQSADSSSRTRPSGTEYEFTLSSSEGALLILPEGAERRDLRNHHRFLELATQHGADWYRFVEERVGQIIGNDSLYLITGLYKTTSWSLAAFEKAAGTAEYPAQFRVAPSGGNHVTATYTWDTTRALDWRAGPLNKYELANQAVFIRGFKVALRTGMFGQRWISVKADCPSTRPNPASSIGAVPGDSWLAYMFGGMSTGVSSGSGPRDEVTVGSALDDARNEIRDSGALAVGEQVVIHRVPGASEAFHPSDVINRYLLNKDPSANVAITHDDVWITLLEENMLQPEDLAQEGRLEALISQKFDIISEGGAVYLQSQSEPDSSRADWLSEPEVGGGIDHEGLDVADIHAVPAKLQSFKRTGPVDLFSSSLVPANQMPEDPPITRASTMTNSDDYRCLWLVDAVPCDKIFRGVHGLMAHLDHVHTGKEPAASRLVCQWLTDKGPCGKTCGEDGFRRHIRTRHLRRVFICTECSRSFSLSDSLLAHQKRNHGLHGGSKAFSEQGAKSSRTEVSVSKPLNSESGTSKVIWPDNSIAGGRLDYKDSSVDVIDAEPAVLPHTTTTSWGVPLPLANEMMRADNADSPIAGASAKNNEDYRCMWVVDGVPCNKIFRGVHGFMAHLDRVHARKESALPKLICRWSTNMGPCGVKCGRDNFRRHIEIHHLPNSREFVCTECGRPFASSNSLHQHQDARHSSMELIKSKAKLVQATTRDKKQGIKGNPIPSDALAMLEEEELTNSARSRYLGR